MWNSLIEYHKAQSIIGAGIYSFIFCTEDVVSILTAVYFRNELSFVTQPYPISSSHLTPCSSWRVDQSGTVSRSCALNWKALAILESSQTTHSHTSLNHVSRNDSCISVCSLSRSSDGYCALSINRRWRQNQAKLHAPILMKSVNTVSWYNFVPP
jgi:hypothetical protein